MVSLLYLSLFLGIQAYTFYSQFFKIDQNQGHLQTQNDLKSNISQLQLNNYSQMTETFKADNLTILLDEKVHSNDQNHLYK